jgi:hypothetical protein
MLGTQETFCIIIAGLVERDSFDFFLPEFDKPWGDPLKGNLLLLYKPLHLEAQHCLQEQTRAYTSSSFLAPLLGR